MGVCVSEEEADNEGVGFVDGEEREKKGAKLEIIKIMYGRATVTVYICTVTVALVYLSTILHNFTSIDVGVFWIKMCKKSYFLYFARLSMD